MAPPRIPVDWIFEEDVIKNSPSRKAGLGDQEELEMIRRGVKAIIDVGTSHGLKQNGTVGAACVYFHRFYMLHSLIEFTWPATAMSCLFLAGKTEETPKKCKDLALAAIRLFPDAYTMGSNQLIEDIMGMERVLLQTIKFDFTIDLPYKYIVTYANQFKKNHSQETIADLVRCAWTLVNDSYYTYLCLAWEPQIIAVSLFWLAIKLKQHEEINATNWWEEHVAELPKDKMESICHEVLDYYAMMNKEGEATI